MTLLEYQCAASKLPAPVAEYRFAPPRRWRFDWAWPQQRVALEQEGGVWVRGRHTRGKGYLNDLEKYNEAASRNWLVIRCTPQDIQNGAAFVWVKAALVLRTAGCEHRSHVN